MTRQRRARRVQVQGGQRCPLCMGEAGEGSELSVCPRCDTLYHSECVQELAGGRCPTPGCSERRQTVAALPRVSQDPLPYAALTGMGHRLRRDGAALHLEPGYTLLVFAAALLLGAVVLALVFLAVGFPTVGIVALPGMLAAMGLLCIAVTVQRQRVDLRACFDPKAGRVRLGARELPLEQLVAVQFCRGYFHRNQPEPDEGSLSYELVLVLQGGKRELLLAAYEDEQLYRIAHELAEFLGLPLLDHGEPPGEPVEFRP